MSRIAVVTTESVPGVSGGNERHWRSLTAALLSAGHEAEMITVQTPESTLAEIVGSYRRCLELDLDGFDVVISGKYPSFMVRHRCHIRHLNHLLRGLHDRYDESHGKELPAPVRPDFDARRHDATQLLDWVDGLVATNPDDPRLAFPGPLSRAVVHALDEIGRNGLTAEATVSEAVARREGYVDPTRPISVIAPVGDLLIGDEVPASSPHRATAKPKTFLTFGRMDRIKRFDLIVKAFGDARLSDAELIVAGQGPMEAAITDLVDKTNGARMVGWLTDGELRATIAEAHAVILAPIDEDYGLVAAEAMALGRPVITTSDSGGIAEQVDHEVTGLITAPHRLALAGAIRRLATDDNLSQRLGRQAQDAAAELSWRPMLNLIDRVLDPAPKPRLLILSTFPASPARTGGQRRLHGVAQGLAKDWDVAVLALTNQVQAPTKVVRRLLNSGIEQILVPRSAAHLRADFRMASIASTPVDDIGCSVLWPATPRFEAELDAQLLVADAVMLSHPFLATALPSGLDIPVIYDAHNVEQDLKATTLGDRPGGSWFVARTEEAERRALELASILTTASISDAERLGGLHDVAHTLVIPNPLDPDFAAPATPNERAAARARFFVDRGVVDDGRPLVVFIGSNHPPNRTAVVALGEAARSAPDLHFVVAGGVSTDGADIGALTIVGPFPGLAARRLHTMADVIANPVMRGSGTNLKVIDALALGVPVVTTEVGARGIEQPDQLVWITSPDQLVHTVRRSLAEIDEAAARSRRGITFAAALLPTRSVEPLAELLTKRLPIGSTKGAG